MDIGIIALISAASFGSVVAIAAFIRQLFLSRDKNLNDEAQRKALAQEAAQLEKMREQMLSDKRFDSHYKVLGSNKELILYIDNKIEEALRAKASLIEDYSQRTLKESMAIVDGQVSKSGKEACDLLKAQIDVRIKFYDDELVALQARRNSLWNAHADLQEYLVQEEQKRNAHLDEVYKQHSNLLEKVFLRHNDNAEHVATSSISAGTSTFKSIIMAPIHFLSQYFNISSGISLPHARIEQAARDDVEGIEQDINDIAINDDIEEDKDTNPDDLLEDSSIDDTDPDSKFGISFG